MIFFSLKKELFSPNPACQRQKENTTGHPSSAGPKQATPGDSTGRKQRCTTSSKYNQSDQKLTTSSPTLTFLIIERVIFNIITQLTSDTFTQASLLK